MQSSIKYKAKNTFFSDFFPTFLQVNIWRTLTKDKTLAEFLLQHLISLLKPPCDLIFEDYDKLSSRTTKKASHSALASLLALKICFDMKEMEAIVESEFAEVFVPLLMGLASYQDIFSVMKAKKDGQSTNLKPFQVATESLQVRFLLVILRFTYSTLLTKSFSDFIFRPFYPVKAAIQWPLWWQRPIVKNHANLVISYPN